MTATAERQASWDLRRRFPLVYGWRATCYDHPETRDLFVPDWQGQLFLDSEWPDAWYDAMAEAAEHNAIEHDSVELFSVLR